MSISEPAATPRQRQRERTRKRILTAAIDSFSRAGFEACSLAEIATAAGVKKALVQYHFQTKEQLWKDAAASVWTERNSHLREYVAQRGATDYRSHMREAFTAVMEFTRDKPQWLWFMFHEASGSGARTQWLVDNFLRDDYELGEQFIRSYQDNGLIRSGPPQHLLHLVSGALTYNLLVAPQTLRVTHTDLASKESIDQQVELLLAMLAP